MWFFISGNFFFKFFCSAIFCLWLTQLKCFFQFFQWKIRLCLTPAEAFSVLLLISSSHCHVSGRMHIDDIFIVHYYYLQPISYFDLIIFALDKSTDFLKPIAILAICNKKAKPICWLRRNYVQYHNIVCNYYFLATPELSLITSLGVMIWTCSTSSPLAAAMAVSMRTLP